MPSNEPLLENQETRDEESPNTSLPDSSTPQANEGEEKPVSEPAGSDEPSTSNEPASDTTETKAEAPSADASEPAAAPGKKSTPKKRSRKRRRRTTTRKKTARGRQSMLALAGEYHKTSVSDEVMIRFDNVTKTFYLYKNDISRFLGMFGVRPKGLCLGTIEANKNLSFEIKKGEAVAFLGLNGAGKSTALKMITGVMYPTSGTVEVNGRVSALLELRAGFDGKLTGRENIRLRGQILGMTGEEIDKLMPQVEEFAELGMYFDQPIKSYSSGMKARLGFSFAIMVNPEILIVDEALSVGDKRFKRKCLERIRDIMMDENVTVLFVTHSSSTAKAFCSRGIVLDKGRKVFEGTITEASDYYEEHY